MRLLLTSRGLLDPGVAEALVSLVGRPFTDLRVAFIPTAANPQPPDKKWLVDDLHRFRLLDPAVLDIVDLAAYDTATVHERLRAADVLVVGGGDTYFLQDQLDRHELPALLTELAENRVYVGISAGSILTNPHLGMSSASSWWGELSEGADPLRPGLGWVDFYCRPHLHAPDYPTSQEPVLRSLAARLDRPLYAVHDLAALVVADGRVRTVGSGPVLHLAGDRL